MFNAITGAQVARIMDYKRCQLSSITVDALSGLASGARAIEIDGTHVGWFCPRSNGIAVIDRPRGYVVIEQDGTFAFREGRYYCV